MAGNVDFDRKYRFSLKVVENNDMGRNRRKILILTEDNCNRRELHVDHHGDIDVEVSFQVATTKTITLLMYSATFGGLIIGKDMQVQLLSPDN